MWGGEQGNRHSDFALITVSSPVIKDLTPMQYVLEIQLRGIYIVFKAHSKC